MGIFKQGIEDVWRNKENCITVAKSGGDYDTIQAAIDAAVSGDTALVFPGEYDEAITLKNGVDIVAVDPKATKILQEVTDNNVECHCYLRITIEVSVDTGLWMRHSNSDIDFVGDIISTDDESILCDAGTLRASGNFTGNRAGFYASGTVTIRNAVITCTNNTAGGHGVNRSAGTGMLILQDVRIVCTHADAFSFYAGGEEDVYCYNVYGNRVLHYNITNLVANGFHLADGTNTDVESITSDTAGVAADLSILTTLITTDGDQNEDNVTLADGQVGQVKHFVVIVEGDAADTIKITPANMNGGTKITFSATPVGEGCTMIFDGTSWNIVANNGGTIA